MKRIGLLGAAAVAVGALGIGVAAAQTDDGSTTTTTPTTAAPGAAPGAPAPGAKAADGPRMHLGGGRKGGHGGGMGGGMGAGIHGQFTVPDGSGGYRTFATQVGEVLKVSPTSIELKSEDGFTKTYAVDDDTMVNAGRDGIADVKVGDKVGLQALVSGDTAKAVHIRDITNAKAIRDKYAPQRPAD
jgi:hypothetical protein